MFVYQARLHHSSIIKYQVSSKIDRIVSYLFTTSMIYYSLLTLYVNKWRLMVSECLLTDY